MMWVMLDAFIRFNLLFQSNFLFGLARMTPNPEWRLRLETQAMGCHMISRSYESIPREVKRRLRLQTLTVLMAVSLFILMGVM